MTCVVVAVTAAGCGSNAAKSPSDAGAKADGPFVVDARSIHDVLSDRGSDGRLDLRPVDLGRDGPAEFTIVEFPIPTASSMPFDITAGPDGNIWFTERQANKIGRSTPAGAITEFPVPTAQSTPACIVAGSDGNLWFTEGTGNNIGRISPAGTIKEFALPNAKSGPGAVALGADGNVWFTETVANRMGRITPDGTISEYSVDAPWYVTAGPDRDLWLTQVPVADSGGFGTRIVSKMTTAGIVTPLPSTVANSSPYMITAGADGNVWFIEPNLFSIGRMTPAGQVAEFRTGSQGLSASAITAGPDGNTWYSLGDMTGKLGRVTPAGQVREYQIPTPWALIQRMTSGPDGNVWFAENGATANKIGYIVP